MTLNRIQFLDTTGDPASAIADKLLEGIPAETASADLSRDLIVLPGRQAVRAVSSALAAKKEILLPPQFVTVGSFLRIGMDERIPLASPLEEKAVWMDLLEHMADTDYPHLFPQKLMKTQEVLSYQADQLMKLRRELELSPDAGTMEHLASTMLKNDERWDDLKKLEIKFLSELNQAKRQDPVRATLAAQKQIEPFRKYARIIVAACPDLPQTAKVKLDNLAESFRMSYDFGIEDVPSIFVYVLCEQDDLQDPLFDEWGCVPPKNLKEENTGTKNPRPYSDVWDRFQLNFPKGAKLHTVQDPREMAELAAKLAVDTDQKELNLDETAIVITDPSFYMDMERSFSRFTVDGEQLSVYDPNGISMNKLRIYGCVSAFRAVCDGDAVSAEAVGKVFSQDDLMQYLAKNAGMSPSDLLTTWDHFQRIRLADEITPDNLPTEELVPIYCRDYSEKPHEVMSMQKLRNVFTKIFDFRKRLLESKNIFSDLREILSDVFPAEEYPPVYGISLEKEAAQFKKTAAEFESSPLLSNLIFKKKLQFFEEALSKIRLYPEHKSKSLEIIGFLEIPFCSAKRIILCGMNEGFLPESASPTPFLNDTLRCKLYLPNNTTRYARDCFYLSRLLETAKEVHFVACKTDSDRNPLRVSSLFFASVKDTKILLDRASLFFETYQILPTAAGRGKQLPFCACLDIRNAFMKDGETILNVTDFKNLIASPIRAFMDRMLNMQPQDYTNPEFDAATLGTVMHSVLQHFELKKEWLADLASHDPICVNRTLSEAEEDIYQRFMQEAKKRGGKDLPLLPLIQTELWRLRMKKLVYELLMNSKKVLEREWKLEGGKGIRFGGVMIHGTIDRIEYDAMSDILYLIDFKTGTDGNDPEVAHIVKRPVRFINLQLPLYKLLLREDTRFHEKYPDIDLEKCNIRCGYFSISKVLSEIGYHFWDDMDQYDILAQDSALQVIEIVRNMQKGVLPENLQKNAIYDHYSEIFPAGFDETFLDGFTRADQIKMPEAAKLEKEVKKKGKK